MTTDGLLADLASDEHMQSDVEFGGELEEAQSPLKKSAAADDEELKVDSLVV